MTRSREEELLDPVTGPHRYRARAPRSPEGPLNLDELLFGAGPIEVDVGFGRGASIFHRAEQEPKSRLLGIEIKTKWASVVQERAQKLGMDHVTIWCGDAREILERAMDGQINRVFVHFADPWWKKRHHKRTVINTEFVSTLSRLLSPKGEVFVQTDVEDRAHAHFEKFESSPEFAATWLEENPFGLLSNRERRAKEDGLPVFRFLATRRECQ